MSFFSDTRIWLKHLKILTPRSVLWRVSSVKVPRMGLSSDEATWEPESNVKLSFIKKYEESISKGIPFSETKDYNVDEEKTKKDKPIAVDKYGFNKYGLKTLEKAKTATTPILGFVLSANQRPRSTGQIRVLKTVNSHTRQSTCIRKRKHNESINCHLDRLMKNAKKRRRYSEANIPGVLRAQYNLMR
uniref:30S ribosomal protein S15 n=1 Tax=Strongyloides venezuelensis TaxID=75913 RepID=A0A0K0FP43_STRVS